ncbi:MAG: pyridoxal phosphate-dependent aminotransferase [Eubacteriales bacterium]|nr:pyridoxal phosphate-dependent aminotransferase [Eubacteriales bacterium]
MLSKQMLYNLENSSAIRKMFIEGQELAAKVGAENVFDFSLGNPVAPVPRAFTEALMEVLREEDSLALHGYMNNAGYPEVRQAVADHLNRRFDLGLSYENIVMTVGAAGAINIIFKAILDIEDDVVVFRPYFGEYRSYVSNYHGRVVEVDPQMPSFQPDLADFERKIDARTKAVLINNPVNPSGVVYSAETLRAIAAILERKQQEYRHAIYLIADEPYRELAYDGVDIPYVTKFYPNTFVAYSFSKTLSIPGERIGYLVVPPAMEQWREMANAVTVANRVCGFINAPSLLQKAVARCLEEKCDVDFYDRNRRTLYDALTAMGFRCVRPQGTFYLFMESPEPDERRFVANAKKHNLILVSGSTFAMPGYVRIAYCVSPDMIARSLPQFQSLAEEYGLS